MRKPLAGLLSVIALLWMASVAQAAFPGLNGKIAFDYHPTSDDIFVVEPDGSGRTAITGPPDQERSPEWSPDGTKIVLDIAGDIFVMNADGTGRVNLTPGGVGQDTGASWSADGSQIVFSSSRSAAGQKIYKMNATDGSNVTQVTTDSFSFDRDPAWSPDGQRIAFERGQRIYTVRPDSTNLTPVTPVGVRADEPNWAPSGARIAYTFLLSDGPPWSEIHTIEPDGTNDVDLGNAFTDSTSNPAWSPNGAEIAVNSGGQVWRMNADGSGTPVFVTQPMNGGPDWQPLPFPGYPRPVAASPIRASLVPAYQPCTSANRTHGPPLAFGSCNPPSQDSPHLTVGTPDANGAAATSVGFLKMRVAPGAPAPPNDTQVWIDYSISDVRCAGATTACGNANTAGGADYAGELEGRFTFRGTDKRNGPNLNEPATMSDYTFRWSAPCSQTADPSTGSRCSMNNSAWMQWYPGSS